MQTRLVLSGTFTAALFLLCSADAAAQRVRRSQPGSVSQTIARTEISVTYNRPVARGRTLFGPGAVVPYGRPWNPGADQATTIEITSDVAIEGRPLSAGRYTVWAIPGVDEWTIIFSEAVDIWHTPYPGTERDALRVDVVPVEGHHMEVLAFYFPEVGRDSATLVLHWGPTVVPLSIRLPTTPS